MITNGLNMATMTSGSLLEETVAFAKSGNRLLAEYHFRKLMQDSNESIDDPNHWLMMAWLAPSPQAMQQALEQYLTQNPGDELAQIGIRWACGIANLGATRDAERTNNRTTGFAQTESVSSDYGQPEFSSSSHAIEAAASDSVSIAQGHSDRNSPDSNSVEHVVQGIQATFGIPASDVTASVTDALFIESDTEVQPVQSSNEASPAPAANADKHTDAPIAAQADPRIADHSVIAVTDVDLAKPTTTATTSASLVPDATGNSESVAHTTSRIEKESVQNQKSSRKSSDERKSRRTQPNVTSTPVVESEPQKANDVVPTTTSIADAEVLDFIPDNWLRSPEEALAVMAVANKSAEPTPSANTSTTDNAEAITPAITTQHSMAEISVLESPVAESPLAESIDEKIDDVSGEFDLDIPLIPESAGATELIAAQSGTGGHQSDLTHDGKNRPAGPSILVVDDSPTVRKLLTMMLSQGGYEVSSAVDGLDAVQAIAARVPQLIITDINMPRLDGYKLCKLVTRNARTKHIPVVMISAGIIDRLRGKLAGCSGYLVKPITPGSLNAVVEFALQGASVHANNA